MELKLFQNATKDHVLKVFTRNENPQKKFLIADEVGLGKTIIAAEIINEIAKQYINKPYIVYYICGNERVTSQNCSKIRDICGGIDVEDVRLSMQALKAKDYKRQNGVIILPLTPATTFTNKNSKYNVKEVEYYLNLRFIDDGKQKKFSNYMKVVKDFKNKYKNDGEANKQNAPEEFIEARKMVVNQLVTGDLKPDMVILDEFQNYSDLLYKENDLFKTCMENATHVLLLSATPYEMAASEVRNMSPYDDKLGFKEGNDEEDEEEKSFKSENEDGDNDSAKFEKLVNFIDPCNKKTDKDLFENVLCRTERSMFYNIDKENEIEYRYIDVKTEEKHLNYTADLYAIYKKIYDESKLYTENFPGIPSDVFISYVKECPAPASFATRYKSLKNNKSDAEFYKEVKKCKDYEKLFVDYNDKSLNPFNHAGLSMLRDQACPEGIEKLLWIPPVHFVKKEAGEDEGNPFIKFKDYTKSLVFGNYRLSTAAPALLLSRYIKEKQEELIKKKQEELNKIGTSIKSIEIKDIEDIPEDWWPYKEEEVKESAYGMTLRKFKELIKQYLWQNQDLILAVTNYDKISEAIKQYTDWGDLKNVIMEYTFLLGLSDDKNDKKLNHLSKMFDCMIQYFDSKSTKEGPTKVICFKSFDEADVKLDKELHDKCKDEKLRKMCQEDCGFAERFTEDNTDRNAHIKSHQQLLQNLFNSPFYPFVIASTSVAQEGLDFHNYCHRIVHWSVAKTPVAYEQREGRIDRFLSHLVRKRIVISVKDKKGAEDKRGDFEVCLSELEKIAKEKSLEKKKPLFPYWYVGEQEFKIITGKTKEIPENWPKFIRVICALPNSRESRYYSKLRAALKQYNYYLGPTYQDKTSKDFCPLNQYTVDAEFD